MDVHDGLFLRFLQQRGTDSVLGTLQHAVSVPGVHSGHLAGQLDRHMSQVGSPHGGNIVKRHM